MPLTNDFIAELVRAANEVGKIGVYEQHRLLERAITTITDMRESVGIPRNAKGYDSLTDLKLLAANVDVIPIAPEEVRDGLLMAAGMIRDLHIVLDTGTVLRLER
jgi:hypothetical protein